MHRVGFYVFLLLVGLFSSCTALFSKIYGINNLQAFDQELYESTLEHILGDYSGSYYSVVSEQDAFVAYTSLLAPLIGDNNAKQPIQMLYFKDGKLQSFRANCHAKGGLTGHLNWNYNGDFDSFIPVSAVDLTTEPAILDSLMKTFAIPHEKKSAITIVFLWNNIFKNLSVEAFHVIVDNMAKAKEADTCSIILVNTDKPYIKLLNQTEN